LGKVGALLLNRRDRVRGWGAKDGGPIWHDKPSGHNWFLNRSRLAKGASGHFKRDQWIWKGAGTKYRDPRGGPIRVGLEATLLPKVCEVWLRARDAEALTKIQRPVAERADILMRGLAHIGIIALVDEATGFQRDRAQDALTRILEAFIAKELQPYLRTFPSDFYIRARLFKNPDILGCLQTILFMIASRPGF
jgi:hypothetical protein